MGVCVSLPLLPLRLCPPGSGGHFCLLCEREGWSPAGICFLSVLGWCWVLRPGFAEYPAQTSRGRTTLGSPRGNVYSLSISQVTPADSGQYVCKAKNAIGETYAAATLKVDAGELKPLSWQVCRGEDVMLTCRVSGQPCPVLQWKKDGRQLSDLFESSHFSVGKEPEDCIQNHLPLRLLPCPLSAVPVNRSPGLLSSLLCSHPSWNLPPQPLPSWAGSPGHQSLCPQFPGLYPRSGLQVRSHLVLCNNPPPPPRYTRSTQGNRGTNRVHAKH
uniref:Ig-like domain-containing protein n=1 Tax=Chelonoidis abingdonii TaxID=106734 RepID=A0A8C0HEY6_CHEAB